MPKIIKVATVVYDNGDGGYTGYCFNTTNEREEHRRKRCHAAKYDPNDEYENGYPGTSEIIISDDGTKLVEPFRFHAGQ